MPTWGWVYNGLTSRSRVLDSSEGVPRKPLVFSPITLDIPTIARPPGVVDSGPYTVAEPGGEQYFSPVSDDCRWYTFNFSWYTEAPTLLAMSAERSRISLLPACYARKVCYCRKKTFRGVLVRNNWVQGPLQPFPEAGGASNLQA